MSPLEQAAAWFREYEKLHRDKGAIEKAERNRERAEFCEQAAREECWTPIAEIPDEWKSKSVAALGGNIVKGIYLEGYCPDEGPASNPQSLIYIVWWEPHENKGNGEWMGEIGPLNPTYARMLRPAPRHATPAPSPGAGGASQ